MDKQKVTKMIQWHSGVEKLSNQLTRSKETETTSVCKEPGICNLLCQIIVIDSEVMFLAAKKMSPVLQKVHALKEELGNVT